MSAERIAAMNEIVGEIAFDYGLRVAVRHQVALARFLAYEKRVTVPATRSAAERLGLDLGRSTTALVR